jgi:hypothetical protein
MSFSWKDKAEEGGTAASMPEGYHKVTCVKVQRSTKKVDDLRAKDGSPQVLTVWRNSMDQEAAVYFTLSEKAVGILASMLKYSGADLDKMDQAGVTLDRFADESFAEKQLLNRQCWCWAEQDGKYTNLSFVSEENAKAGMKNLQPVGGGSATPDGYSGSGYQDNHQAVEDDDIPF